MMMIRNMFLVVEDAELDAGQKSIDEYVLRMFLLQCKKYQEMDALIQSYQATVQILETIPGTSKKRKSLCEKKVNNLTEKMNNIAQAVLGILKKDTGMTCVKAEDCISLYNECEPFSVEYRLEKSLELGLIRVIPDGIIEQVRTVLTLYLSRLEWLIKP